jgi:xanthine dehydrogenase accessory factor
VNEIYTKLAELLGERAESAGNGFALCTVVGVKGSAPRRTGAKMIVFADGRTMGTIGGGAVERSVIANARAVITGGTARLFRHDLLHQHNMCCGGTMEIFIDPMKKKSNLYIFGAGHTGAALAKYAVDFPFDVFLIDDRKEQLDACDIAGVHKMNLDYRDALPVLPFDDSTYVCIMTYSHPIDREILAYCLKKPHAYLGMIGSRRKTGLTRKMFMEAGIGTEEELQSVDMPMGVEIHAEGPEEIAVSILGKLIEVKNGMVAG